MLKHLVITCVVLVFVAGCGDDAGPSDEERCTAARLYVLDHPDSATARSDIAEYCDG